MKSKITLLITASAVGLVALSAIQAYLVNNTYQLRKDAFIEETRNAVTIIDDHLTRIDSMRSEWRDAMVEIAADYKQEFVSRDSILYYFGLKTDSMNGDFIDVFYEELEKGGFNPTLKFQKKVSSIVLLDSLENDTLYHRSNNPETYRLGEDFEGEGYKLSGSTSYSEYTFTKTGDGQVVSDIVRLNFETETVMNIEGWEADVLGQMKGLLSISIVIFLFVFGLLFYSIKNLIMQKKIAEVKTDFINNISHEFKTPLATLTLATGMLKEATKSPNSIDTIAIIDRQNMRLQKLLNQVLDNSLSYNEITLNKESVPAQEFLSTLLNDFELSVQGTPVELKKELALQDQEVSIDRFYLTTALSNILENAVKYNSGEAKLRVSATIDGLFRISIQDNGIGISEKEQKNLFEKFYRVGNKEVHEVKGLGLGLFYADQIVKAHGGRIQVQSKIGQGTTFTIELPFNNN